MRSCISAIVYRVVSRSLALRTARRRTIPMRSIAIATTLTSATTGGGDLGASAWRPTPTDFESAWKLARARYWLGTNGLPAARAQGRARRRHRRRRARRSRSQRAAARGSFLDRRQHGRARRVVRPAPGHQVSRADPRRARDGAEARSRVSAGIRRSRARPLVLQGAGPVRRQQEEVGSSTCARRSPTTRRASSRTCSSPRR